MNKRARYLFWILLPLLLLVPALALVQLGWAYGLSWSSIDGGGHTFSTGGTFDCISE